MFRKMKRLLRLRNKGGFTLVEVIISCALLGLLVMGVFGFVTPVITSVGVKRQNARATLLSEAIDSYIANSVQYAFYVQVISYCASGDTDSTAGDPNVLGVTYADTTFPNYSGKGLSDLLNCLHNDLAGEVFELKCLGVRWMDVPGSNGQKKLMLTNEKVDQTSGRLDPAAAELVFDPAFYEGLYPIVLLENYSNQYPGKDADGNEINMVPDDKVDIAPAMKIVTEVYLDDKCYCTNEGDRQKAIFSISGSTYAEFSNIKSNLMNKGVYKIQPQLYAHSKSDSSGATVGNYDTAYNADASKRYEHDANYYYYPNTFIYYIARKTKTGSDPDTSAPPSSDSTPDPAA